jgi:hypothetical protein
VADAHRQGCTRRLALGLRLAHELLRVPLPEPASRIIEDPVVAEIARNLRDTLFDVRFAPFTMLEAIRLDLRLCDTAKQRALKLLAAVFVPRWGDWLEWRLPRALFALYYPLRLVRLARKYVLGRLWPVTGRLPGIPAGAMPRTPPPPPRSTG